jgi:hypothetical protein
VVNLTLRSLYPLGRSPLYPVDRLGEPQSGSGRCGEGTDLFALTGNGTRTVARYKPKFEEFRLQMLLTSVWEDMLPGQQGESRLWGPGSNLGVYRGDGQEVVIPGCSPDPWGEGPKNPLQADGRREHSQTDCEALDTQRARRRSGGMQKKQEDLGRTYRLLSFHKVWTI